MRKFFFDFPRVCGILIIYQMIPYIYKMHTEGDI